MVRWVQKLDGSKRARRLPTAGKRRSGAVEKAEWMFGQGSPKLRMWTGTDGDWISWLLRARRTRRRAAEARVQGVKQWGALCNPAVVVVEARDDTVNQGGDAGGLGSLISVVPQIEGTICAMAASPRSSPFPETVSSTSNVQRLPSCVNSPSNISKRKASGIDDVFSGATNTNVARR